MFVSYYKLTQQPFGVTPNPRFLYLTPTHREAIASIVYAVMENRGFSALIAPPGMGKTTLLFELLQRLGDSVRTVFLFQFQPSPEGLLRNLLSELGVPDEGENFEEMQEKLNQLILRESKSGKRIVVVVDEAQNFQEPVLEVLRMLSNFETSQEKLIHIILSGQPQLADILFSPQIEQLRQRISIMAVLRPLNAEETKVYIEHRLQVAGYRGGQLFTSAACERIAQFSQGIPRNINNLCFNAMSLGFALKRATIDSDLIDEVFRDLNLESAPEFPAKRPSSVDTRNRFGASPITSTPPMWTSNEFRPTARKSGFVAGVLSFAAVLCLGGVFARQYAVPSSQPGVSLRTPAPPVPQVEITAPPTAETAPPVEAPPENAEKAVQPETNPSPDPSPAVVPVITKRGHKAHRQQTTNDKAAPVMLVRVAQRETLYELCSRNLRACDINKISEIRRLNPRLRNATQVESGEAVRLPWEPLGKGRARYSAKINSEERP